MIDERTGQPSPCPICDSGDVRWRHRRWYDIGRTWVRYYGERLLGLVGMGRPTRIPPSTAMLGLTQSVDRQFRVGLGSEEDVSAVAAEMRYDVLRDAYNSRVAMTTPDSFWSCKACGRKGDVFEDSEELLSARAELAALEDSMHAEPGRIRRPIDRDGLAPTQDQ